MSTCLAVHVNTKQAGRLKSIGSLWELLRDLQYLDGATPEPSPEPSLLNPPSVYHPGQYYDLWNCPPSLGQPHAFKPGMSIEQLLESVAMGEPSYAIESMLDDQLMSMWMGGPPMWREYRCIFYLRTQFQQQHRLLGRRGKL